MKNLKDKKLIIILGILVLFSVVFVGCANDEAEEPIQEPTQQEQQEPIPEDGGGGY